MIILGIESSCDETSIAIVKDGSEILGHQIHSQIDLHQVYGGVVPELASRAHLESIHPLLELTLAEAKLDWKDLDALAVTCGPGLQGALLVGYTTAQTLSWLLNLPLIGVNHLEGHIYANFLAFGDKISFPLLVLLVSGGHTQLIEMQAHGQYQIIGQTRDDAMGEAFDKVARLLNLDYPGGPIIDQRSKNGDPQAFAFPRALPKTFDFSFSGLKTAVLYTIRDLQSKGIPLPVDDLCASFQAAAIDNIVPKALDYAQSHQIKQISVTGGVSANSALRKIIAERSQALGLQVFYPPLKLCTDNAAMIASCAWYQWQYRPSVAQQPPQGIRSRYPLGA